jgi:hypothetical protein
MLESVCKRHWNLVKPGETVKLVNGGRVATIGLFTCNICDVLDRVKEQQKESK